MNITRIPIDTETDYLKCLPKNEKKTTIFAPPLLCRRFLLLSFACSEQII